MATINILQSSQSMGHILGNAGVIDPNVMKESSEQSGTSWISVSLPGIGDKS